MTRRTAAAALFTMAAATGMTVAVGLPAVARPADQLQPTPVTVDRLGTASLPPVSGAPAPPQTDAATDSHVYVDAHAGTPRALAMVHLDFTSVPPDATVASLLLRMNDDPGQPPDVENVNVASAAIVACPLTEEFSDGTVAAYDCDRGGRPVAGQRSATGQWQFRLDPLLPVLLKSGYGVALVPEAAPGATFSVALLRGSAVATAGIVSAASPGATEAPIRAVPAAPVATVPPAAPPIAQSPVDLPAGETTPAPTTVTPPTVATPTAPVALTTSAAGLTRLPRWMLFVLPVVIGLLAAAADRRTLARVLHRLAVAAEKGTTV